MKQYSRVSYAVRCQIFAFLQANYSIREIALRLNFHKSTIYREIKRNTTTRGYKIKSAQKLSLKRKRFCRRKRIFTGELKEVITSKLKCNWSPEQIVGRYRKEGVSCVSHETIYRFMRKKENRCLYRHYNRRGMSRYSRTKMKRESTLSIHQRPDVINKRLRVGDWERDTMYIAKKVKLLIITDRKTRYTAIAKFDHFNSKVAAKMSLKMTTSLGRKVYSMTNDNGTEFRGEQKMGIPVYYCDPQKPQQRGTVENTIGMLRRQLSLKTCFEELGTEGLKKIEKEFNLRPRKCLDYRTPYEVFFKTKVALAM